MMTMEDEKQSKKEEHHEALIPGLPDEIAEICLLHVPYPYQSLVRSVSSSWNRATTHPSFLVSKKSLSRPYLFVLAFHKHTARIQWQTLDPSSGRWLVLPKMPLSKNDAVLTTSFSCASLPRQGKLFVMGGGTTTLVYSTATNRWSSASEMPAGESLFAAEGVNGRIVTVGGSGTRIYDPESDTWRRGAGFAGELARYEAVVVGGKVYVTEGWWWPFTVRPRGWVYESESDRWREMGVGMRDGWTGMSVAAGGRLFVIAEYGDSPVKVYDEETDTWRCVEGDRFPREALRRPFGARGLDDRIYVVSSLGLNVAIGTVVVVTTQHQSGVKVTWQLWRCCMVDYIEQNIGQDHLKPYLIPVKGKRFDFVRNFMKQL